MGCGASRSGKDTASDRPQDGSGAGQKYNADADGGGSNGAPHTTTGATYGGSADARTLPVTPDAGLHAPAASGSGSQGSAAGAGFGPIDGQGSVAALHRVSIHTGHGGARIINNFTVVRHLGEGAYGQVSLVRDSGGELYAMKACSRRLLITDKGGRVQELEILRRLQHPNIIRLTAFIDDPAHPELYMVFDYVDGGAIMDMTDRGRAISPPYGEGRARVLMQQTVAGLEYLHSNNIVHRDIKPENILVSTADVVKIADFGVSHFFHTENDSITKTRGTPYFMAPEMCRQETVSGKACDVWALGVTLYVMLHGVVPFLKDTAPELFAAIREDEILFPRRSSEEGGELSPELRRLILRMTDKSLVTRITLPEVKSDPWITGSDFAIDVSDAERIRLQRQQLEALRRGLDAPSCPAEPLQPSDPGKRQVSILIVEDVFLVRDLLIKMLRSILDDESQVVQLSHANDGGAAAEMCRSQSFLLVIMDVHMPKVSGLDATMQIRRHELESGLRQAHIVGLTADQHATINDLCGDAGMDCVVPKPITPSKIRSICDQFGILVKGAEGGVRVDGISASGKGHAYTTCYRKFLEDIGEGDDVTFRQSAGAPSRPRLGDSHCGAVVQAKLRDPRVSIIPVQTRSDDSPSESDPSVVSGSTTVIGSCNATLATVRTDVRTCKIIDPGEEGVMWYLGSTRHSICLPPSVVGELERTWSMCPSTLGGSRQASRAAVSATSPSLNQLVGPFHLLAGHADEASPSSPTASSGSGSSTPSDPKGIRERSIRSSQRMARMYKRERSEINDVLEGEDCWAAAVAGAVKALLALLDNDRQVSRKDIAALVKRTQEVVAARRAKMPRREEGRLQRAELLKQVKAAVDASVGKAILAAVEEFREKNCADGSAGRGQPPCRAPRPFQCVGHSDTGKRVRNEDAYVQFLYPSMLFAPQQQQQQQQGDVLEYIAGVFDGHGGVEAAEYLGYRCAHNILLSDSYPADVPAAIVDGCLRADADFAAKADAFDCDAGSTVLVAVMRWPQLWFGNIGDCRAVLFSRGQARTITRVHNPADPDERAMVEAKGGEILNVNGGNRVNGLLLVTRSMGDRPVREVLSQTPDVHSHTVDPAADEFIVMASDGLWDVMSAEEVCAFVSGARSEIDASWGGRGSAGRRSSASSRVTAALRRASMASTSSRRSIRASRLGIPGQQGDAQRSPSFSGPGRGHSMRRQPSQCPEGHRAGREEEGDALGFIVGADLEESMTQDAPAPTSPQNSVLGSVGGESGVSPVPRLPKQHGAQKRRKESTAINDALELMDSKERSAMLDRPGEGSDADEDADEYEDYQVIPEALAVEAIDRGSTDNTTVVILFFSGSTGAWPCTPASDTF